jgi:ADP-heptose:LPS heptosyltransferase
VFEGTLLIRRGALGDVTLLGSVTRQVSSPVTVLTSPCWAELARRLDGVDEVIAWDDRLTRREIHSRLPRARWVDLQGDLRTAMLCAGRLGARRIHKRSIRRRMWVRLGTKTLRPSVPEIYAEACGVTADKPPWITVPSENRDTLALIPGAAWATKVWRSDGFIEVGRTWDGPVVVLGGPGEEGLCSRIAAEIPNAGVCVERGFDDTIAVLSKTDIAVGGDTGLAHVAGACGATVVALFGPTHPDDGFFVYRGEVVQRSLGCRPCTLHRQPQCPEGGLACMDIGPGVVASVIARYRSCAG